MKKSLWYIFCNKYLCIVNEKQYSRLCKTRDESYLINCTGCNSIDAVYIYILFF